jgi:hypothetical protein
MGKIKIFIQYIVIYNYHFIIFKNTYWNRKKEEYKGFFYY